MGEHKINLRAIMAAQGKQQIPIDLSQAEKKPCPCGCEFFNKVFRVATISKLAPGNHLNQDITVEFPGYVCSQCGLEFGKAKEIMYKQ